MFTSHHAPLAQLTPDSAAYLLGVANDIVLIVSHDGVILDVAINNHNLVQALDDVANWIGCRWAQVATPDSHARIATMIGSTETGIEAGSASRTQHVHHPARGGTTVPVLYTTSPVRDAPLFAAFGRDLSDVADLQQRLIDAQQAIERDYTRLRHVETRYRLLFETACESLLIVDAATLKLLDANPAARALLGELWPRGQQRTIRDSFTADGHDALLGLLATTRAIGSAEPIKLRLAESGQPVRMTSAVFRHESTVFFLLRLHAEMSAPPAAPSDERVHMAHLAAEAPDGLVVTGADGRITASNAAFRDMAQLLSAEQARGEKLERWLGRPGVDMDVLLANLRQRGVVRLFHTLLRGEYGAPLDVEVSAVQLPGDGGTSFGFAIRHVGRRPRPSHPSAPHLPAELPRSVEQLTDQVGRVPLKDLVREATDTIERLCIETALSLTRDNRASAAELLGLSRQSLYVKLRRYGLGDLSDDAAEAG